MRMIGGGGKTASLGLFNGLRIPLLDPKALPESKDEWILILGGAGSVGQYAIQVRSRPPLPPLCLLLRFRNIYIDVFSINKKHVPFFSSLPNFADTRL